MSIRFTQSCPTCGRRIQVCASLLGRTVACQHCNAEFVAQAQIDGGLNRGDAAHSLTADPLMARVEQALKKAREQTAVT